MHHVALNVVGLFVIVGTLVLIDALIEFITGESSWPAR